MDTDGAQLVGLGAAFVIVLKLLDVLMRWLINKIATSDTNTEVRIEQLEARVKTLEEHLDRERSKKHAVMQDASAYLGTIHVVDTLVDGLLESCEVEGAACPPAVHTFVASCQRVIGPAITRGRQREREAEVGRSLN